MTDAILVDSAEVTVMRPPDTPLKRQTRKSRGRHGRQWPVHIVLIVASLTMVFPFVWQIIMSLSTNAEIQSVPPTFWPKMVQWHNYADVFHKMPFARQLWVSVLITVARVLGQLITCTTAGYAFARIRFPGRGVALAAILSIMMVPSQVYLITQYQIVQSLGLLNTTTGLVLPGLVSAFGTFLMRQFFVGLPKEMEEAARLDGANHWQVFWKVMLPLAAPGLSSLAIITTLWSWNELLWPLVITTQSNSMPLSAGIATMQGEKLTDFSVMMAASTLAMAPMIVLFLILQRRVIEGLATSGMKG